MLNYSEMLCPEFDGIDVKVAWETWKEYECRNRYAHMTLSNFDAAQLIDCGAPDWSTPG